MLAYTDAGVSLGQQSGASLMLQPQGEKVESIETQPPTTLSHGSSSPPNHPLNESTDPSTPSTNGHSCVSSDNVTETPHQAKLSVSPSNHPSAPADLQSA